MINPEQKKEMRSAARNGHEKSTRTEKSVKWFNANKGGKQKTARYPEAT